MGITNQVPSSRLIQPGVCTSTTRPASPYEGQAIYETDTDKVLYWSGSAWYPNWNLPWGQIAYATKTSNQGSITTTADVAGLSVTFTAVENRRYAISTEGMMLSTVAGDNFNWIIADGSNNILTLKSFHLYSVSLGVFTGAKIVHSPAAGSFTYKIRAQRNGGTGSGTVIAASTYPAFILVEDIGPA